MNLDKLILVDPNLGLCQAWTEAFQKLENVEIVNDRFENLMEFDCMVSAANSYGLMDGGVDLAIINFFGPELQTDVQGHISEHYYGEQPVGTSFIARTNNASHPYVAHTPTMRVPRNIAGTEAVYQSMRAMLIAVHNFNKEENLEKEKKDSSLIEEKCEEEIKEKVVEEVNEEKNDEKNDDVKLNTEDDMRNKEEVKVVEAEDDFEKEYLMIDDEGGKFIIYYF